MCGVGWGVGLTTFTCGTSCLINVRASCLGTSFIWRDLSWGE